jgi:hypothetical protein
LGAIKKELEMNQETQAGATQDAAVSGVRQIVLRAEAQELNQVIEALQLDLADAPLQVRQRALDFFDLQPELVSIESGPATGATVPFLLKPSQGLLDLALAVRTGDFDALAVKYPHCFPPSPG